MDFDLSEDQVALRDAASAVLDRLASVDVLRARIGPGTVVGTLPGAGASEGDPSASSASSAPVGFDRSLWSTMAEQGWMAVEVPEADGGLGFGMVEVAVLCEQLGRRVAPAPYLSTVLAIDVLRRSGIGELEAVAEHLAAGEAVGCVSFEPGGRSEVTVSDAGPGPAAEGSVRLSGRTAPVVYGPSADVAVVVVGDEVFAVLRDGEPLARPEPAMDRTRELGRLTLDGAVAFRVGGVDEVTRLLDRGATAMSAELLGVADHALGLAVAYAKDRVQFGKPIGSFQAVKHRLADALVDVEGMRSTAYYAAWCTATGDAEASLAASMAKSWCTDASRRALASSLQVHGGIGFTWEHELHCYLKRGQLDQVSFGDGGWHRDRIAALLKARLAAGGRIF